MAPSSSWRPLSSDNVVWKKSEPLKIVPKYTKYLTPHTAQLTNLGYVRKKALLGVRSPCFPPFLLLAPTLHCKIEAKKLLKMKLSSWKSYYICVVWIFITPGCTALSISQMFHKCFVFEQSVIKTKHLRTLIRGLIQEFDWLEDLGLKPH